MWVLPHGWQEPKFLVRHALPPRLCISRKLDWKVDLGCLRPKQQLSPVHCNACHSINVQKKGAKDKILAQEPFSVP